MSEQIPEQLEFLFEDEEPEDDLGEYVAELMHDQELNE